MESPVLALDLGGTHLRGGLVTTGGEVLRRWGPLPFLGESPAGLLALVSAWRRESAEAPLSAVVAAVPGPLDLRRGVLTAPVNLPLWREVPLRRLLAETLGVPALMVNDASAFTFGETVRGAAAGSRQVLGMTLGTGVGSGAVVDGRLLCGTTGNALELGHLILDPAGPLCNCGRRGCLEQYASATAVSRRARELAVTPDGARLFAAAEGNSERITARMVGERAAAGDDLCRAILAAAGQRLGEGLAQAALILDPDTIVIGGGLARCGELILAPARAEFERRRLGTPTVTALVPGALGDDAALIGAAVLAADPTFRADWSDAS